MIEGHESVDAFIGVDVGKTNHHGVALGRTGRKPFEKPLPQDEAKLRAVIDKLTTHGTMLLVVDLPGLALRRIADLHLGEAKSHPLDAHRMAMAVQPLPVEKLRRPRLNQGIRKILRILPRGFPWPRTTLARSSH